MNIGITICGKYVEFIISRFELHRSRRGTENTWRSTEDASSVPENGRSRMAPISNHRRYLYLTLSSTVTTFDSSFDEDPKLASSGYRITVDEGRESFFAICIEEPGSETAWIMSDTVRALDSMR